MGCEPINCLGARVRVFYKTFEKRWISKHIEVTHKFMGVDLGCLTPCASANDILANTLERTYPPRAFITPWLVQCRAVGRACSNFPASTVKSPALDAMLCSLI